MNDLQVARGLGLFSLGLGAAELFSPRWLGSTSGISGKSKTLRAFGAREIASGIAVLSQKKPGPALWNRVVGDAIDLAFLGRAYVQSFSKRRVVIAMAAVLGVTLLDVIYARRFSD